MSLPNESCIQQTHVIKGKEMLVAMIILPDQDLGEQLQAVTAQRLIRAGAGLITNGEHTMLTIRDRPEGWFPMAVKVANLLPKESQCAA